MNEQTDHDDERVEQMLRRWGADEAARRVQPGAAPIPSAKRPRHRPTRRRAPLAAAAGLLLALAAGGGLLVSRSNLTRQTQALTDAQADAQRLAAQLAQARRDLDAARAAASAAGDKAVAQASRHLADVKRLRDDFRARQVLSAEKAAKAAGRLKRLEADLAAAGEELKKAKTDLAKAKTQLAAALAAGTKPNAELARLRQRLAAANTELTRLGKQNRQAILAQRKAANDLILFRATQRVAVGDYRRAYLSAAARGRTGLAACQAASANTRMLARCAELRPSIQKPATRKLFDRIEVLLTRLDLIDPDGLNAAADLVKIIRDSDVLAKIDAAAAIGVEGVEVRQWLIEAGAILAGVQRVG